MDCTDEEGRFSIDEIPLGEYFLVANDDGRISSEEPFPAIYYPGVLDKEKATVLSFAAGDEREGFDIHIPSEEPTGIIKGRVLFSDRRPVAHASVEFTPATQSETQDGTARAKTDAEGRFSISILRGLKGSLRAHVYASDFPNCPPMKKLNDRRQDIQTNRVTVETKTDLQGVELLFPFPYCEKELP